MDNKILYNKILKIIKEEDKNPMETLEEISKELEIELITNGKTRCSIKQAFKRLRKENTLRPKFQNVLRNGNEKNTITNGYFLITYDKEQLPEELQAYLNPNKKEIDDGLQFENLKNTDVEKSYISINYDALLKIHKYKKIHKLKDTFTLQNNLTFNIQYFLDILALLNEKDLRNVTIEASSNTTHPLNILSKNGKAILLPIRQTCEEAEEELKLQQQILQTIY